MITIRKQEGFSLFMVMILVLVIALLVMVTAQSSNTEMRMSTNEADRKFAVSLADEGLREAENVLLEKVSDGKSSIFTYKCDNGYCAPSKGTFERPTGGVKTTDNFKFDNTTSESSIPAWERCSGDATKSCKIGETVLDDKDCNTNKTCIKGKNNKVHYIIEYLGSRQGSGTDNHLYSYFRITSRAQGNNADTKATLQTYVELQE